MHLGMTGNRDLAALPRLVQRDPRAAGTTWCTRTSTGPACTAGSPRGSPGYGPSSPPSTRWATPRWRARRLTAGVRALYLASERLGRATVAVSPTVADRLRRWGVPGPRIEVVPNGIDVARFRFDPALRERTRRRLGLPHGAYVVGGVGTAHGRQAVRRPGPGAGRTPRRRTGCCWSATARRRTCCGVRRRQAGVADRVLFTGERPDTGADGVPGPRSAVADSAPWTSFASPCAEEAFGLAVVEALAAGLPVLYVSCPAVEDLPPGAAPVARRVQGGSDSFARALRQVRAEGPAAALGPGRRPPLQHRPQRRPAHGRVRGRCART